MKWVGCIKRFINRTNKRLKKTFLSLCSCNRVKCDCVEREKEIRKKVHFELTLRCNYNCEYCTQRVNRQTYKNSEALDAPDEVVDAFIKYLSQTHYKLNIFLFGGELFVHKRVFDVIKAIFDNGHDLLIISNFSFPIETYKKVYDIKHDKSLLHMVFSLHETQVDPDIFINKAIELKEYLKDKNIGTFSISSVLTEENFDLLKAIDQKLVETIQQHLDFQNYIDSNEELFYSERIEKYLNSIRNKDMAYDKKYTLKGKTLFGTECSTGQNYVVINPNGDIKRCSPIAMVPEDKKENGIDISQYGLTKLGNIKSGKIPFYKRAMPCLSDKCICPTFYQEGLIKVGKKNTLDIIYCKIRYIWLYKFLKNRGIKK